MAVSIERPRALVDEAVVRYQSNRPFYIGALVVGILVFFNVLPLIVIIASSFMASGTTLIHEVTFENWTIFINEGGPLILNTFVFAAGGAMLTTIFATGLAWIIARTNAPLRRVYYFLAFIIFIYPPIILEQVWIRLLGDNGIYAWMLGVDSLHVYSMGGMIFVQGVRLLPVGLILLIPLFAAIDKSLIDAGRVSGASMFQSIRYISAPLILPGILVVFLFTFLINLETFRVPLIIGLPAEINVLAIEVYRETNTPPIRFGVAMAQAVFLVAISLPLLYLYKKVLGKTDQYVTVSGRGFVAEPNDVGRWKYVLSFIAGAFLFFVAVMPGLMILYISFLPFYMPPHATSPEFLLSSMSIDGYVNILGAGSLLRATFNSFLVAFVCAFLLTGTGMLLAWLINKTNTRFRRAIDYLAFFPIGFPAVSFALGLMVVWLEFPLISLIPIYGTLVIFVVAFFSKLMPSNLRVMETGVFQVDASLIEAAKLSGASTLKSLWYILVPVIYKLTRISWILTFVFVATEVPIVMMLRNPRTEMIASIFYRLTTQGEMITETYALATVLTVVFIGIILLLHINRYKRFGVFS